MATAILSNNLSASFLFFWINRAYGGAKLELFSSTLYPTNRTKNRDKDERHKAYLNLKEKQPSLVALVVLDQIGSLE